MAFDEKYIDGVLYTLVHDDDALEGAQFVWMPWDRDGEHAPVNATEEEIAEARKRHGL